MSQQFYSLAKKRFKARQDVLAQTLIGGSISSMEEYKHIAGKLRGLEEGKEILRQAFQDFFNDGDDYEDREVE